MTYTFLKVKTKPEYEEEWHTYILHHQTNHKTNVTTVRGISNMVG